MRPAMKSRQNGAALIELALVLPLLLVITALATEFGRALYQYNTLTKSVRDAARYLSMRAPGTDIAQARNLVVYGNTAGTGAPLVPGLSLANVPTPTWASAGTFPTINTVTVSVTGYTFTSMYASVFGVNFGNIPYSTIRATMRSPL